MKIVKYFLLTSFLFLTIGLTSASAIAVADYINVTENWNGSYDVSFTIESSYDDIVAFAVGTNYSYNFGASIGEDSGIPLGWAAAAVVKDQNNGWQSVTFSFNEATQQIEISTAALSSELLALLNELPGSYTSAFLYYGGGALSADTMYSGFYGKVYGEDSSFVALRDTGEILSGETAVPVPGASMLLLSGLLCLAGKSRRR